MRRLVGVAAALFSFTYTAVLVGFAFTRIYWPTTVSTLSHGLSKHTHVEVRGVVIRTRAEDDGDRHIWLRDLVTQDSVLGECVPKIPCLVPKAGSTVTLRGLSRRDPEHGWYEVHPIEEILP